MKQPFYRLGVAILGVLGVLLFPEGSASACSVCFTSIKGEAALNAYYTITILLTVLALGFIGGMFFIYRHYGKLGEDDNSEDRNR